MKTLIAIPVMGQRQIATSSLYQFDRTASPDCQFLLIDNSVHPSPYPDMFERGFLNTKRWLYWRNDSNVGLVASCQQAYNHAVTLGADILVMTHNDVWVYPSINDPNVRLSRYWDRQLCHEFAKSEGRLGVIGLFGSKGCGREGHRLDTFGSLIEIAGHGRQMTAWIEPAVCLDGFFLACSMAMLKEAYYECPNCGSEAGHMYCALCKGNGAQRGGFDQRYHMHHVYDYDIALTSIELGYRNAVINIPCHHLSGLTANNDAFATSGQDIHQANYDRWLAKWSAKLGLSVDEAWNYTWRQG